MYSEYACTPYEYSNRHRLLHDVHIQVLEKLLEVGGLKNSLDLVRFVSIRISIE